MSQRSQSDGGQKGFAVGRGLLAAAETLNFSVNEQRSGRQMGGAGLAMEGQDGGSQMSRHGAAGHLGSTMKLFASLGLSPSDLDALAQIPEEDISVDTLPQILMQLKSRKGEAVERRAAAASVSSDKSYRGGRDAWEDGGRMGGASLAQSSASSDFGFMQDVPSARDLALGFGGGGGGGGRERSYSDLSRRDSYGGLNVAAATSDSVFLQRRMGSPSHGKVQDFLGVMPAMFPHVCSLCDFDVHSIMEWNQHVSGLRHAENRRVLLNMYPEWDPGMGRSGSLLEGPNLSAGLHGPGPMSSGQTSSWGGAGGSGMSGKNQMGQNKLRSRVVVVKYDRKPLSNKTLFAFTEPFGRLREHLVLKNKAFLEMESHEEAQDMVSFYQQQPASLYGKPVTFYLSQRLLVIEKEDRSTGSRMDKSGRDIKGRGSQVVFFSNLPREEEKKKELLTIAERFGTVEKHLFLTDQAFVQLGTPEDAEMLVKYYMVNRLTIKGRPIRLNICTKYKTLNVNRRQGGSAADARGWRGGASSASRSTSSFKPSSSSKEEERKEEEEEDDDEEEVVPGVVEGDEEEEEEDEKKEEEEEDERREPEVKVEEESEAAPQAVKTEAEASEELMVPEKDAGDQAAPQTPAPQQEAAAKQEDGAEPPAGEAQITEEHAQTPEGDLPDTGEQDFLQNMEDFVTLDELPEDEDEAPEESDAVDNTRKGGMRVVNMVGFRRGYGFLDELLGLAKPFGKVVKHLVLDLRPEAYLQFATEEEARAMAKFYNSNVTASVCGRPVRVSHSMTYPTIQCGSSKVVYVGQLPGGKYSDESVLQLAEPHGTVRKYFLNRIKRECFIEMEEAEQAERMAEECKANPPKFNGKRLSIYVSRKYRQLKHGHRCPTVTKGEESPRSSKHPEEPPAKKAKVEETKPADDKQDEEQEAPHKEEQDQQQQQQQEKRTEDEEKKEQELSDNHNTDHSTEGTAQQQHTDQIRQEVEGTETLANPNGQSDVAPPPVKKASVASLPLPPFDPDSPIGVEHVKMGYYCRVCFLFYSNEDTAKKTHCSSQTHYDKLQKYLEKEQSRKSKGKTSQ